MHNFAIHFPHMRWVARVLELRIDVNPQPSELERELETLYRRLNRRGDALHGISIASIDSPGLIFHHREADGEHYIYVEDPVRRRLAGYTVFNRLVEVSRRADRHLRAPHSKYAATYQRRGIATAIYRWWLEAGHCLISGARQSASANALWCSLGRRHELIYVDLREKVLRYLGQSVDVQTREDLHTRMMLLGRDWNISRLVQHVQLLSPSERFVETSLASATQASGRQSLSDSLD